MITVILLVFLVLWVWFLLCWYVIKPLLLPGVYQSMGYYDGLPYLKKSFDEESFKLLDFFNVLMINIDFRTGYFDYNNADYVRGATASSIEALFNSHYHWSDQKLDDGLTQKFGNLYSTSKLI